MEKARLFSHLLEDKLVSCATVSLNAISPNPLSYRELETAYYNRSDLLYFSTLAKYKFFEADIFPTSLFMTNKVKPSDFFSSVIDELKTLKIMQFLGGLMITNDIRENMGHLMAITKLHTSRKATIVDFMYSGIKKRPHDPYIRKVGFDDLDRRVLKEYMADELRLVVFLGTPAKTFNESEYRFQTFIDINDQMKKRAEENLQKIFNVNIHWREEDALLRLPSKTKRRLRLDRKMKIPELGK